MEINDFAENYGDGWVKIFRSIRKHWIWNDPIKFQRWIDILLEVNHTGKKVNIGYDIYDCYRGQSFHSLRTWAKMWNTTPKTVQKFLKLLEKDEMISLKIIGKGKHSTTCITVCKYDSYQSLNGTKETLGKRKVYTKETQGKHNLPTNKNDKNDKNDNKEIYSFDDFWNDYDKKSSGKVKSKQKWDKLSSEEKQKIKDHLPKYIHHTPDKTFRKNAETYLHQKHWESEIEEKKVLKSNPLQSSWNQQMK